MACTGTTGKNEHKYDVYNYKHQVPSCITQRRAVHPADPQEKKLRYVLKLLYTATKSADTFCMHKQIIQRTNKHQGGRQGGDKNMKQM